MMFFVFFFVFFIFVEVVDVLVNHVSVEIKLITRRFFNLYAFSILAVPLRMGN